MESHKVLFWDLCFFLLYIDDLPKIINKISTPRLFTDDTSILFALSNPIDLNKNIHIVLQL